MYPPFTFGNTLTFFLNTNGPRGFIWRFILGTVIFTWALYFAIYYLIALARNFMTDVDMTHWSFAILPIFLTMVFPTLLVWTLQESALQRHLIRTQPYKLRLSGTEVRIFLSGVVLSLIMTLVLSLFVEAMSQVVEADGFFTDMIWIIIVASGFALMTVGVIALLTAAPALTLRDNRLRVLKSAVIIRRHFWAIFGSWAILGVILTIKISLTMSFLFITIGPIRAVAGGIDYLIYGGERFWLGILLITLDGVIYGFLHLMASSPGALAVVNDPNWSERADADAAIFG